MMAAIPTIESIQRTNLILVAATATALALFDTLGAGFGCLLGGAVVIGNLYILGLLGRAVIGAAGGGAMANRAGLLVIPLKLLLIVVLVYLVFKHAHIDPLGFGAGVLTQLLAISIQTWRASMRPAEAP
jgi:ATP synthase I subunit